MRRKDMEVSGFNEVMDIIGRCDVLHLGMVDEGKPYIVPLNFGYKAEGEKVTFYFHSAKQGRKLDILKKNPFVCFEMECSTSLYTDQQGPCKWTMQYESVMGEGKITFIEDAGEKEAAFTNIMKAHGFEGTPVFPPNAIAQTQMYQLTVSDMTAKKNTR